MELATILGVSTTHRTLPTVLDCLQCGGRLHVYEDNTKGGAWHHCFDCNLSGDTIEMAAAFWKMPVEQTIVKLAQRLCVPFENVDRYLHKHVGMRHAADKFWAACQKDIHFASRIPGLAALRHRFRVHSPMTDDRWAKGPGVVLGACDRMAAEKCFQPNSVRPQAKSAKCLYNPSAFRLFKGAHWREVLAVPYYDLPGRICGFHFVGRRGHRNDHVFRTFHGDEAGLAGLPTCYQPYNPPEVPVLAVNDDLIMARLQVRHSLDSRRPLPIVAWRDKTVHAWHALPHRRLIFWACKLNAKVLAQAIRCDGWIAIVGPDTPTDRNIDLYLGKNQPADLHRLCCVKAWPWQKQLATWADRHDDGPIEALLTELRVLGIDIADVIRRIRGGLGDRLQSIMHEPEVGRTVRYGPFTVTERQGCWFSHSTATPQPRMILDAVMRIDEITLDDTQRVRGRIIHKGTELPFDVTPDHLDHHIHETIRRIGLRHGRVITSQRVGTLSLMQVALLFQEPRFTPKTAPHSPEVPPTALPTGSEA